MTTNNEILSFAFPGIIEKEILDIGSGQIPYMRTKEFSDLVLESEQLLLNQIGCNAGKVIVYTASGTAAMESSVVNYASNFNKILAINGGTFGQRWKELCDYHHIACDEFKVDFGKDINYEQLENYLVKNKYQILLCQHHETSSGQLYNMELISEICKQNGISLIVDAISSFLSDPFNMSKWGIDIAILSSQKGLNLPPGLSFLVVSDKAIAKGFNNKNFYLDIFENLKNLERGQTPYSPATTLFLQLNNRLRKITDSGIENILHQVNENALYFRKVCEVNNWRLSAEIPSSCITGFYIENGRKICDKLVKKRIYVMPSGKRDLLRISHTGLQNETTINNLVNNILNAKKKLQ